MRCLTRRHAPKDLGGGEFSDVWHKRQKQRPLPITGGGLLFSDYEKSDYKAIV